MPATVALAALAWAFVEQGAASEVTVSKLTPRGATGIIHLETVPGDAVVTVDGKLLDGELSPFVITGIAPGRRLRIEVAGVGHQTWATTLHLRPGQELRLPTVSLPPLDTVEPARHAQAAQDAQRVQDDEVAAAARAGATPENRAEAQAPAQRAAHAVLADEGLGLRRREAPRPAVRATRSTAQAKAKTRAKAKTQAKAKTKTKVKQKRLARAPKAKRAKSSAPARATPRKAATTARKLGVLRLNSDPPSTVTIDGRRIGRTPQLRLRLAPGKHTVTLENAKLGKRKRFDVSVPAGGKVTKVVKL